MEFDNLFMLFITIFIWNIFEMIMLRNWVGWFYKMSIPIYTKSFYFTQYIGHKEFVQKISDPIEGKNNVVYHLFDDNLIGFREEQKISFFKRRSNYTPIMRGLIEYDLITKTMKVKGILNLSTLLILLIFAAFAFVGFGHAENEAQIFKFMFLIIPIFVIGMVYYQQSKVYNELVEYLKKTFGSVQY